MKKVTLYIPCFNSSQYLTASLSAVLDQTYPVDEILVVDDGSTDETVKIVSSFPVRLISHGQNKGLAAARNTAFREARNEFIAALDADCVADRDWLLKLMSCFRDESVVGVGGCLIEKYTDALADRWRARHMAQHWGGGEWEDPPFLFGSNTVMKKSRVLSIGLYDERFRENHEDVDVSKRLFEKGYRLAYSSYAIVHHLKQDSIESVLRAYWQWYYEHNLTRMRRAEHGFFSYLNILADIVSKLVISDLIAGRYRLLIMDVLLCFYFPWLDIRNYLKMFRNQ